MRKLVVFLVFAILTAMLSGCILSKSPSANALDIPLGDNVTFSVDVFPRGGTYVWTLDDAPLTNPGNSYLYTATAGNHTLVVKAKQILGTDTQTWNITCNPITDLLNSMVRIPAGTFMMGSTDDEYGWAYLTTPVHQVTLQAFDIGAYEVTQAQYQAVMGTNPSHFQAINGYPDTENNPVEMVNYYDARAFCTALSVLTGRTFTLPSEEQWEYACRAGTTTLYSYGDSDALIDDYAWWWNNSNGTGGPYGTHPVGTKPPNAWVLYDMMGNVWEWCLDSFHDNYTGAPNDGSAWEPETGTYRMTRGGSWRYDIPGLFRSGFRYRYDFPGDKSYDLGFRVLAVR